MKKLNDDDIESLSRIIIKYKNNDYKPTKNIRNQIILGQNSIIDSVKVLSFLIDYSKCVEIDIEKLIALLQVEGADKKLTLNDLLEISKKI